MSDGLVTLLRLHIQAALGSRLIGTIGQIDMESLYTQMFEGGLIGAHDVGVFGPAMLFALGAVRNNE
jgi:hypothetical protein